MAKVHVQMIVLTLLNPALSAWLPKPSGISSDTELKFLNRHLMTRLVATLLLLSVALSVVAGRPTPVAADEDPDAPYQLGPDSKRQDGVPQGDLTKHVWQSQVFEGTTREYFVYVPKQYDGTQPACVMVFQDGHAYVQEDGVVSAPVVFDNLIHAGDLPVTIGVFVNPGHKDTEQPEKRWEANNRSFEYDTLSDQYAKFIQEELLPHIAMDQKLNLSTDPADRAICGASSGGICAFTVACDTSGVVWQSVESYWQFHKHPRRSRLPGFDSQNRTETDSRISAGWRE